MTIFLDYLRALRRGSDMVAADRPPTKVDPHKPDPKDPKDKNKDKDKEQHKGETHHPHNPSETHHPHNPSEEEDDDGKQKGPSTSRPGQPGQPTHPTGTPERQAPVEGVTPGQPGEPWQPYPWRPQFPPQAEVPNGPEEPNGPEVRAGQPSPTAGPQTYPPAGSTKLGPISGGSVPVPLAGTQIAAQPIMIFKVVGSSDALPELRRLPQQISQTFNFGTPVQMLGGYLQACPAIAGVPAAPATNMIAGFSTQHGDNLLQAGVMPQGGSAITYDHVPNQPNAVNIPIGAPMADGATGVWLANDTTIFRGVTDSAHVLVTTDFLAIFGLTKDTTTGNWFVDTTITTVALGACVQITDLIGTLGLTGQEVGFRVLKPNQQLRQ